MTTTSVPIDTKALLANLPASACSRSLYFDRYAKPGAQRTERSNFFTEGFRAHASTARADRWSATLPDLSAHVLYAQLQSRLMVNMAGGVMENAGLCLDRFGMPYIPGSAVKGCARRAALAALHEWCETKAKPGESPSDEDNLFKAACALFASEIEMLVAIAKVFGWCDQDWKDRSDFAWACGPWRWDGMRTHAWKQLRCSTGSAGNPEDFEARGGTVSWLPAMPCNLGREGAVQGLPVGLPSVGQMELDVVTCHHRVYYGQKAGKSVPATDTEEPVPVVFPAVAAGHVFAFALRPIQAVDDQLLAAAKAWLKCGLEALGIGAKTSAGYGWFDASEATGKAVESILSVAALAVSPGVLEEIRRDTDPEIRRRLRQFALADQRYWPASGREAGTEYQFTLIRYILDERRPLFDKEKSHAGSDFAKGVRNLAKKFGIQIS